MHTQNKELERQLEELRSSHQKELTKLTKRKDAELASADQLQMYHQQAARTMAKQAETAFDERDRAQETAAAFQTQIEAFTERITKLDDRIHHVRFTNKRLEPELQEARLDATRGSANSGNILKMAIDVSGLQEQPAPPD